jgi:uncharacterized protein (TIGR02145 family)
VKRLIKNSVIAFLLFGTTIYLPSCKKEETTTIPPAVATTNVSDITQTTALIEGTVTDNGGTEILIIGSCWSTSPNPTISSNKTSNTEGSGSFTSSITGLTAGTKYYVRAYAINISGTSYGNELTFTTSDIVIEASTIIFNPDLTYGAISDIDGNTYKTIQIGNQTWMAENLRTTRLNDETLIPNVKDGKEWGDLETTGYSWYNNDASAYTTVYGAYYNWFTVNTGKLCPSGWHVPSDTEWSTLTTYLGGASIAGGKLMETGNTHWLNLSGATNSTGFTGLPGSFRAYDSFLEYSGYFFFDPGLYGYWWSASESESDCLMGNTNFTGVEQLSKNVGASVRCVKND